jgi:tetratricopeptide (TPR) repeat protein
MNEIQVHTMLEQAHAFAEEGKWLHAMQMYQRLIMAVPWLTEPYIRFALVCMDSGQAQKAERILRSGHRRNPENAEIILMLGDLASLRGRYSAAVDWYNRLRRRRIPRMHFSVGLVHLKKGNYLKAEEEFRTVLSLDGHFPRIHEALGEALLRQKLPVQAIGELRRALRLDPYSSAAHRLVGNALLQTLNAAEAFQELTMAVDMDPRDDTAWHLCGEALLRLKRYDEAEQYIRKSLSLNPRSPDASASYGFICLHRGEYAKALRAFNTALRLHPGHPRAMDGKLHLKIQERHPCA